MKTSDLIGPTLDYSVAKCEEGGKLPGYWTGAVERGNFSPSTDWSQGGPLIERGKITLHAEGPEKFPVWVASLSYSVEVTYSIGSARRLCTMRGNTPLIAAMRCLVASRLGDEVEIPEELCK